MSHVAMTQSGGGSSSGGRLGETAAAVRIAAQPSSRSHIASSAVVAPLRAPRRGRPLPKVSSR